MVPPLWKTVWWLLKKETHTQYTPCPLHAWLSTQVHTLPSPRLGIYPRKSTHASTQTGAPPLKAAMFLVAQRGKNPNVHKLRTEYIKCSIF